MKKLQIPYVRQIHKNTCGAAALEMAFRYYGVDDVSQTDIFERYKKPEPHGSDDFYIKTKDLISYAQERGFDAAWYRVDPYNIEGSISTLKGLVEAGGVIIVCQQYTKEQPQIGHFRVILGVNEQNVYLHDPSEVGGPNEQWSHKKFMDYWRATGQAVTGGVYIVIKPKTND